VANDTAVPSNRIERILAFMIGGVAGVSILSILAVVVGNLSGADFRDGLWPYVQVLPLFGLALAFVLIILLTVLRVVRLRRTAEDGR